MHASFQLQKYVIANADAKRAEHGQWRQATVREETAGFNALYAVQL